MIQQYLGNMTNAEKEVRENLALINTVTKKLDIIRNELIPYYGATTTLEDVEKLLWIQYEKFNENIKKIFEK